MEKVYLAKKGDEVVCHASLEAMKALDGIETPDREITETEFAAAGGLARVIDGEIVLGKTEAEIAAETNAKRKAEIGTELLAIDAKSGRAARAVAVAVGAGKAAVKADAERLAALETEAKALRSGLAGL
jgi:hypothetical protein